jgi:hypothetical protein
MTPSGHVLPPGVIKSSHVLYTHAFTSHMVNNNHHVAVKDMVVIVHPACPAEGLHRHARHASCVGLLLCPKHQAQEGNHDINIISPS